MSEKNSDIKELKSLIAKVSHIVGFNFTIETPEPVGNGLLVLPSISDSRIRELFGRLPYDCYIDCGNYPFECIPQHVRTRLKSVNCLDVGKYKYVISNDKLFLACGLMGLSQVYSVDINISPLIPILDKQFIILENLTEKLSIEDRINRVKIALSLFHNAK